MARPVPVLLPALLPVLLLPSLPLALPSPPPGSDPPCPPGRFRCTPRSRCFPEEWRCDGHPDCVAGEDEQGCPTPTETSPEGTPLTATLGSTETSAPPVPGDSVPTRSQGHIWVLITAVLLSILIAVGSVAVWGLSKAKSRSDLFGLEKLSREQLMPDKSQTGLFH